MDTEAIKKTIEDILSLLGVSHELTVVSDESTGIICFHIKTGDPQILIGRDGTHLAALSHIIKRIADKASPLVPADALRAGKRDTRAGAGIKEQLSFVVDVNNYQGKKTEELKNKAAMLAERARYFKSNVEMSPMTPYERMIIHSIFSNTKDIKTESMGEGRNRRVVIKYVAE